MVKGEEDLGGHEDLEDLEDLQDPEDPEDPEDLQGLDQDQDLDPQDLDPDSDPIHAMRRAQDLATPRVDAVMVPAAVVPAAGAAAESTVDLAPAKTWHQHHYHYQHHYHRQVHQ